MQRQRGELVPIGEVIDDLDGPAIPSASPQARHHFTVADQVDRLVAASEADPDRGFMARTMALCSLPRTNPGNRYRYVRRNGPYTLVMSAGGTASLGIEAVAELGNTDLFTTEINANMNAVAVIKKSLQGGGTPTATGDFTVTTDHPLVTMIAPSPDWFVGVHGESLLDAGGQWRMSHSVDCASIWIAPQRMRTSFAFEMATMPPKVSGVDYSVSWDGDYFSDGFGGGTPRNPSSRRSSRISAMTSAKFSRTSSGVLP